MSTAPAVEARHVSKRFGGTQALDDVTVVIECGEVHALVGENGAGKSTLGKIVGGVHRADSGELYVGGRRCTERWDAKRALEEGIAMIQQELTLVPARSVEENVFLGLEDRRFGVLRRNLRQRFDGLNRACGFDLDPRSPVGSLPIADQQKVEIMRSLARDAQVIIMDEPTSSLTADETARLHSILAWLKGEGRAVVYITHFLDNVLAHSDRVTVMRDGRIVRTARTTKETKRGLIEAMLGAPLDVAFPALPPPPPEAVPPALEVRAISRGAVLRDVSLHVRPGEIVGLAGLVGSGRTEIARAIFGADPIDEGEILVDGRPYLRRSPRRSICRGMALIPEDRRAEGLIFTQPVRQNITLPHLGVYSRSGLLGRHQERRDVRRMLDELSVVPSRVDADVATLSGGNQQRVLFAKWLVQPPRVVLLDEPTRGIDVGAKQRIYELIVQLARSGTAVLLISSELEEVLELSHRVYLLHKGQVVGETAPAATSVETVLFELFGLDGAIDTAESASEPASRPDAV